jgi:hypothetical protein
MWLYSLRYLLFCFYVVCHSCHGLQKCSIIIIHNTMYNYENGKQKIHCVISSKIPHCLINSKIPHCLINSKIPHCLINSKIPHCLINSKIPHCLINYKIPHCLINSKIPHCLINSKIPHCLISSKIPHCLINSKILSKIVRNWGKIDNPTHIYICMTTHFPGLAQALQ